MDKVRIFDTTLRDGEQAPGCSMNLEEKIEIAKQLEKMNVDVIEAGFAIASPMDFESVSEIAKVVKNAQVASLSRANQKDIETAFNAVKKAESPLIHTFIATSPIHMEYKLKMTPEKVLEHVQESVKYARSLCPNIEFSAEDAMRSDKEFLAKVVEIAIKSGASVVNIPDTVGYRTPNEIHDYITYLMKNVPNIGDAIVSVHCHNDLGLGVANSLAGVEAGARQIECTVNGLGERAGNASMEEIVMALKTRSDNFGITTNIDTTQIYKTSKLVSNITGVPIPCNKAIIGANAFAHESGIHQHGMLANPETYEIMKPEDIGILPNQMVLGKHSGRHAFTDRIKSLGYELPKDEIDYLFKLFKDVADKKKTVTDSDVIALLTNNDHKEIGEYQLVSFVINTGNTITSTANVKLKNSDDKIIEKVAIGDGPVDSSFKAINKITKKEFKLMDYRIVATTGGEDALGEVTLKLTLDGDNIYTGRGVSTDIVESSIKAYLNGVNKILS